MNTPISQASPSIPLQKPAFACIRCSERKVKCNRQTPCNTCVRHNVQCIFRAPKSTRRRRLLVSGEPVEERLGRYEALLKEQGIDLEQPSASSELADHSNSIRLESLESRCPTLDKNLFLIGAQKTLFTPELIQSHSGTKFVDNSLWSRVAEEQTHDAEQLVEEHSSDDDSDGVSSVNDFAYVLFSKVAINPPLHPPANLILRLWQTFVENVNPLTKTVHVPSLQLAINKAIADIEHVPKGFEALMFAIYSMAVLSMSDDECKEQIGEARVTLLARYVAATKLALSRAKFMSSHSIVVVQALMLHILSIRDVSEPRALWSLTGLAIRVAEGMGMRVDGTLLGLSPFETEIRRRVWWQLKMHDFRAAELSGQAKFRDFELNETTPKKPANVNDDELYLSMAHPAVDSTRPTEMLWIALRSELASFASTQKGKTTDGGKNGFTSEEYAAMDDMKIKDDFIAKIEDMIEIKFLRFCDPSEPLHLLVLLGARSALNLIRFTAHHPRRWTNRLDQVPDSERQFVWSISLQLLERYSMLQSSPQLRRFAWNVPYFIQWHAVIHILDTLRTDPLHKDSEKAWQLIHTMYAMNEELLLNNTRPLFVAVGSLCLKAYSARATTFSKDGGLLADRPEYINKLGEQREGAKRKKQALLAERKRQENITRMATQTGSVCPVTESMAMYPIAQSQQYLARRSMADPDQGNIRVADDAFWLGDGLDMEYLSGGRPDVMDLDQDAFLDQDYWLHTAEGEVIDWKQWDM